MTDRDENAVGGTTSVAKYSKGQSPDGVWDMCGNVGEWVSDWYDDKYYSGGDSAARMAQAMRPPMKESPAPVGSTTFFSG